MPVIREGPSIPQLDMKLGKWIQAITIETGHRRLSEHVRRGFDPEPVVVTDGVIRRDPNLVKIGGRIEFVRRTNIADAVRWALTELQKRSPVLTGRYASSHVVMLNNEMIVGNIWQKLRQVKAGDKVQIVNTQPYARKLEGATASKRTGRSRRRAASRQARGGIYRPVLRAVAQRYGKTVYVDLKYVRLNTGVKVWGAAGGGKPLPDRQIIRGARGRIVGWTRPGRTVQRDQVYPALVFFAVPSQVH